MLEKLGMLPVPFLINVAARAAVAPGTLLWQRLQLAAKSAAASIAAVVVVGAAVVVVGA